MAIVLGQQLVKDTEKYNDYAIGITLPIQIGNTAFNQSFTTIEQTKSNIKNLDERLEDFMKTFDFKNIRKNKQIVNKFFTTQ